MPARRDLADVLHSRTVRTPTGCVEWTGCHRNGYGRLFNGGRTYSAHRVAYELAYGPIPSGLMVLHRCDNPPCCNPAHLVLGSQADNMRDMAGKGRGRDQAGERNPRARLTASDVRAVLDNVAAGTPRKAEALRLGVHPNLVHMIVNGQVWRTVYEDWAGQVRKGEL